MSTRPHTNLFTRVDRTRDPDFFIRFMDEAQKPSGIQACKRLMLERITAGKAQEWWEHVHHADERGMLLMSFTAFMVVGSKS